MFFCLFFCCQNRFVDLSLSRAHCYHCNALATKLEGPRMWWQIDYLSKPLNPRPASHTDSCSHHSGLNLSPLICFAIFGIIIVRIWWRTRWFWFRWWWWWIRRSSKGGVWSDFRSGCVWKCDQATPSANWELGSSSAFHHHQHGRHYQYIMIMIHDSHHHLKLPFLHWHLMMVINMRMMKMMKMVKMMKMMKMMMM